MRINSCHQTHDSIHIVFIACQYYHFNHSLVTCHMSLLSLLSISFIINIPLIWQSITAYMLNKIISFLIVVSFNSSKCTRGLDAFSGTAYKIMCLHCDMKLVRPLYCLTWSNEKLAGGGSWSQKHCSINIYGDNCVSLRLYQFVCSYILITLILSS
jgi:hypothetical protein